MADEPNVPPAGNPPPVEPKPAKYTDDDMNALVTKGKAEAVAALLRSVGLESTDSLKDNMKAWKEYQDKNKTEAEKAIAQAKEAGDKLTAAETRALNAELKAEALAAGIDPKKLDRALKLAASSEGETPADKIAGLLKDFPEFKGGGTGGQNFGGQSRDQGGDKSEALRAQVEAAMGLKKKT